jgi:hypothetical protein
MPPPERKALEQMDRTEIESALVRAEEMIVAVERERDDAVAVIEDAQRKGRSKRTTTKTEAASRIVAQMQRVNTDEALQAKPTVYRDGMMAGLDRAKKTIEAMPVNDEE